MGDWGIKVTKTGKGVSSTDLRDLLMHSNYAMFKYHIDTTTSMIINAGDTSKTITIAHNLGYVPAFMVYSNDSTYTTLLPQRRSFFTGEDEHIFATADSTNIYIKWRSVVPYNQFTLYVNDGYTNFGTNSLLAVGKYSGSGWDCGYRFTDVPIAKNAGIHSATVEFRIDERGNPGTDVKIKTWGIDEDNVGAFGSDLGKTKTTAETSQNVAAGAGSYFGINVKSIVEEITTRSGWSSGNAMGFYTFNNDSPDNTYISDLLYSGDNTFLRVILSGTLTYNFRILVFKDKIS